MSTKIKFSGSIPRHYQDLLTTFIFDRFSVDLVKRIGFSHAYNVLELASGTGSLTKQILAHLPAGAHLTATDLQTDMLAVAKQDITASNVSWDEVDMTNIPYIDDQYDLVICQFGLMLVPDKLKALTEMHRVLKPKGRLIFSVWAAITDNLVWSITGRVIESFLGADPILQDPGPFSMQSQANALALLHQVGFSDIKQTLVSAPGTIESAALAAQGMLQGLPVFMTISKKAPELLPQIESALENELISQLGNYPLTSPLAAWVFEITKAKKKQNGKCINLRCHIVWHYRFAFPMDI